MVRSYKCHIAPRRCNTLNADTNNNGEANAEANAKANAEANAEANAKANAKANAEANAKANSGANGEANAKANAEANAEANAKATSVIIRPKVNRLPSKYFPSSFFQSFSRQFFLSKITTAIRSV